MSYLIAYKPCGCASSWHPADNSKLADRFRAVHTGEGEEIREVEEIPHPLPNLFCPHGSLPAQLAAKLAAAESRREELVKWLREWIAESEAAVDTWAGGGTLSLCHINKGKANAYREVLARIEGTEGQR